MVKLTIKMELVMTTDTKKKCLCVKKIEQFDQLSDTMHDAEKKNAR